jgi:hypothetical protein
MADRSTAILALIVVTGAILTAPSWAQDLRATPSAIATGPQAVKPAPSVTVLSPKQAQSVLGKKVRSSANEDMGRIVDIIVDRKGFVRAAVIDFGGFLGVGSRKIAVDWNALHFAPDSKKTDSITLNLTRDQVKGAPEYKDKHAVVVLGPAGVLHPLPDE